MADSGNELYNDENSAAYYQIYVEFVSFDL